jgi:MFS family permease
MEGFLQLPGWRWLFFIEGLVCIGLGITCWYLLPDFPETTKFITPSDRLVATSRVKDDDEELDTVVSTSNGKKGLSTAAAKGKAPAASTAPAIPSLLTIPQPPPYTFQMVQVKDILSDPQFHLFALTYLLVAMSLDALSFLAPEIAAGTFTYGSGVTGYSIDAALVSVAPYGVACGLAIMWSYRSDRTGDRGLHVSAALVLAAFGFLVIALTPETSWAPQQGLNESQVAEEANVQAGGDGGVAVGAVRYFLGLLPASVGLLGALPCLLAFAMDRAHGITARETAAAMVTALGSVGCGVLVPFLFPPMNMPDEDAIGVAAWGHGYTFGSGMCALSCFVAAGLGILLRWMKRREDEGMWGRGPGLRRLLNDAGEKGAWDDCDESMEQIHIGNEGWGALPSEYGKGSISDLGESDARLAPKGRVGFV